MLSRLLIVLLKRNKNNCLRAGGAGWAVKFNWILILSTNWNGHLNLKSDKRWREFFLIRRCTFWKVLPGGISLENWSDILNYEQNIWRFKHVKKERQPPFFFVFFQRKTEMRNYKNWSASDEVHYYLSCYWTCVTQLLKITELEKYLSFAYTSK